MKSVTQKIWIFLEENAKFILAIGFQTVICGTCFCDWLIQTVFWGVIFCDFGPKSQKKVPQ